MTVLDYYAKSGRVPSRLSSFLQVLWWQEVDPQARRPTASKSKLSLSLRNLDTSAPTHANVHTHAFYPFPTLSTEAQTREDVDVLHQRSHVHPTAPTQTPEAQTCRARTTSMFFSQFLGPNWTVAQPLWHFKCCARMLGGRMFGGRNSPKVDQSEPIGGGWSNKSSTTTMSY